MTTVVPVYKMIENNYGVIVRTEMAHRLYLKTLDGREFSGYIRKLVDNEYTAFMRIPFDIPSKLFDAAARGTVSKYQIKSKGEDGDETEIAEIVFGVKR